MKKKIIIILILAGCIGYYFYSQNNSKQGLLNKYRIQPKGENWRPETIEKITSVCIELGGKKESCLCSINYAMKHYKENEYLTIRNKMLTLIENGISVKTDPVVEKLVTGTASACKK